MDLLRTREVAKKLGMTRQGIHMLRRRDTRFPNPIVLSSKVLRWDETEINKWITEKKEKEYGKSS